MPKLTLFAPCERVILGQGDNSASLIVVIQEIRIQGLLKKDEKITKEMGAFANFVIFSQWHRVLGDGEKVFEQRILLGLQGEPPVIDVVAEFQMTERLHRVIANIPILPVMSPGEYNLQLFIREKGDQDWKRPVAEYPINVVHLIQYQPQAQ